MTFAWLLLFRSAAPPSSFQPVGREASFADGTAHAVGIPGVFVGRTGGRFFAVLQEDGCSLGVDENHYRDCRGVLYELSGSGAAGCGSLDLLLVAVYQGTVYIDPDHPQNGSPAPAGRC